MALQDGHREVGLIARVEFAAWFDNFQLQKVIVVYMQVGTNCTCLLIDIDHWLDKLVEDNFEICRTRFE